MYLGDCSWKNSILLSLSRLYAQHVSAVVVLIDPAITPEAFQNSVALVPPMPYMRPGTTMPQKFFAAVR